MILILTILLVVSIGASIVLVRENRALEAEVFRRIDSEAETYRKLVRASDGLQSIINLRTRKMANVGHRMCAAAMSAHREIWK